MMGRGGRMGMPPMRPMNPNDIKFRKIFVGGLPRELTDEEFNGHFE